VGFQGARFNTASFDTRVGFERASFEGDAVFDAVSFQGRAWFGEARFQGGVWFRVATFDDVGFREASFEDVAAFEEASLKGSAVFDKASFKGSAVFDGATFEGVAVFDGASFHGDAGFTEASFLRALEPGLMLVNGRLALDGIVLEHPVQLEIAAVELSCQRMRFRAGGHLRLVGAALNLEEAEIPAPLIVSAHQLDPDCEVRWREVAPEATSPPRLVSVQRADVAGLAVTDLDLSVCHFAGAHHLDQLKITGSDTFLRVATGPLGGSRQVLLA
jgi:Pentapeptide repeats (9 copies)